MMKVVLTDPDGTVYYGGPVPVDATGKCDVTVTSGWVPLERGRDVSDTSEDEFVTDEDLPAPLLMDSSEPLTLTDPDIVLPVTEPIRRQPRPGRNDPCPCGSGRKWKRCCVKERQNSSPLPQQTPPPSV